MGSTVDDISGFPGGIRKVRTAVVTGAGRILPIVESVGRRVIREIDPDSPEGRRLLAMGRVELWSDGGIRADEAVRVARPFRAGGRTLRRMESPPPGARPKT